MPMPGLPAGIAGVSSLIFATTDSVVSKVAATEVAFCSALLLYLADNWKEIQNLCDVHPTKRARSFARWLANQMAPSMSGRQTLLFGGGTHRCCSR